MQKKFTLILLILLSGHLFLRADSWTQKTPFPLMNRWQAVGFSIGNKGYLGTGTQGFTIFNDFWEYDPATNAWTQKANVGGHVRQEAVGFSIANKGYVCTGSGFFTDYQKDLWEYDPASNTWTRKSDFPGMARFHSTVFTIGNKAYLGGGSDSLSVRHSDFFEYNPSSDTWTQKADMFSGLDGAVGFSIDELGYFCSGSDTVSYTTVLWQYNPNTNQWAVKANLPAVPRWEGVGFSLCEKGYIGMGSSIDDPIDWWQYNPATDSWTAKTSLTMPRYDAIAFVIGNKGYMGTGNDNDYPNDWAEYSPDSACTIGIDEVGSGETQFDISPSVVQDYCELHFMNSLQHKSISLKVSDSNGRIVFNDKSSTINSGYRINARSFSSGVYFITLQSENGIETKRILKY